MSEAQAAQSVAAGDLLGLYRLQGGHLPAQGRDARLRALRAALEQPGRMKAALCAGAGCGWHGMAVYGDARLFAMMKEGAALPAAFPVVPNLQGFMREAVEYGMVGAGMRRAWRVGPAGLIGLGLRSVGRLPALARRDFPTMLQSFIELELAEWQRFHPPFVFLHPQMTDLALALDNPRILEAHRQAVRRCTGGAAGYVTDNPRTLAERLARWGIKPGGILAAWDASTPEGRAAPAACRQLAKAAGCPAWGVRRDWISVPGDPERQEAQAAGLVGFVRYDLDAWTILDQEACAP